MKREELEALGLTKEQIDAVMKSHGVVVTALNEKVTTAEGKVTTLETEKGSLEKEKVEKEKLVKELQEKSISKEDYDAKLKEIEDNATKEKNQIIFDNKLEKALEKGNVKQTANTIASIRSLLKTDLLKLDGENIVGLKEQLEEIKKTDAHFFEENTNLKGYSPADGADKKEKGSVSTGSTYAQSANKVETIQTKSSFFN